MYYVPHGHYYVNVPWHVHGRQSGYWLNPNELMSHYPSQYLTTVQHSVIKDYGGKPFVVNIEQATKLNNNFRTALWTGNHFQVTLMSIGVGEDIGLERHPTVDQFLRLEDGEGIVQMGKTRNNLSYVQKVAKDDAIMVPAGTWHNVTNTGDRPLKLYSIYAPPEHPFGTVHHTKAEAMATEQHRY